MNEDLLLVTYNSLLDGDCNKIISFEEKIKVGFLSRMEKRGAHPNFNYESYGNDIGLSHGEVACAIMEAYPEKFAYIGDNSEKILELGFEKGFSRKQAEFFRKDEKIQVKDLNSRTGCYFNGELMPEGSSITLANSDLVSFIPFSNFQNEMNFLINIFYTNTFNLRKLSYPGKLKLMNTFLDFNSSIPDFNQALKLAKLMDSSKLINEIDMIKNANLYQTRFILGYDVNSPFEESEEIVASSLDSVIKKCKNLAFEYEFVPNNKLCYGILIKKKTERRKDWMAKIFNETGFAKFISKKNLEITLIK